MRRTRFWITAWLWLAAGAAWAQELPDQPIRVVVPYGAGSSLDARARVVSEAVGQRIKRRVIVENRPGAGGTLGTLYVARARPDGGTLLFTNSSHVVSPHVYGETGYDTLAALTPVAQVYTTGLVLVAHPSLRASSLKQLVALARDAAVAPAYASSGTGGLPHLAMEMFMRAAGIELVHVPYRGDAQGLTDVLAGRVQVMLSGYPAAQAHVRAGTLRALAVTSSTRADIFPDAPTMAEAGYPGATLDAWAGYFAPAATPGALVERLNRDIAAALAQPSIQAHFAATGAQAAVGPPAAFAAIVNREWDLYRRLVRELKLSPE